MKAMVLINAGRALELENIAIPIPDDEQVLIRVHACGVCRTDLHIFDGDLNYPELPLILGHEIVGTVEKTGKRVKNIAVGERIGIPWLGKTCGYCQYCRSGKENLCSKARFTGYQINGGYAEYTVADARYCFPIPDYYSDTAAAPLLCAGLIGYRSLRLSGPCQRIGLYGFGAAAHITIQIACHKEMEVFAFTRPGDDAGQAFAKSLGAVWAGGSATRPPKALDAALIFAPIGNLIPAALKAIDKGGTVVCAGIHMSDIPAFPYEILWGERVIRSVANLTRLDGDDFFTIAPKIPINTEITTFPLEKANDALEQLRKGQVKGAVVLRCE